MGAPARIERGHWRFSGAVGGARLDPTRWRVSGWPTLAPAKPVPLHRVRSRQLYDMLVSERFAAGGYPRAFSALDGGGVYCQLWRAAHGGAAPSPADVRALFVAAQCAALPQRARQSAYLVTVRGLPLGYRVGGEAACPVCASHDVQRTDSHEHAVLGCPLAALVWLRVLEGWVVFSPSDAWAAEAVAAACGPPVAGAPTTDATTGALQWSTPFLSRHWRGGTSAQPEHGTAFAWSPAARLAVLTGARPAGQRAHAER